jgi:tetratricopeptide (TPR) repeat protein
VHYQYEVGDMLAAMAAYQEANKSMTSWHREHLNFTGMYNDLGVFYFNLREYTLSQKAFENVIEKDPTHFNALSNLASLKASVGDVEGADALYLQGSQLEQVPLEFMHNYGVHSLNTRRREASLAIFDRILQTKSSFYQSRTEIAKQLCMQDKMHESYAHFELALADAAAAGDISFFWQIYFVYVTSTPILFPTVEYVETFRSFYLHNLYEAMTLIPKNAILRPEVNLGCSYVGYYLIYQGNNIAFEQHTTILLVHNIVYNITYLSLLLCYVWCA